MHEMVNLGLHPAIKVLADPPKQRAPRIDHLIEALKHLQRLGVPQRVLSAIRRLPPSRFVAILEAVIAGVGRIAPAILALDKNNTGRRYTLARTVHDLAGALGSAISSSSGSFEKTPIYGGILGGIMKLAGGVTSSVGGELEQKKDKPCSCNDDTGGFSAMAAAPELFMSQKSMQRQSALMSKINAAKQMSAPQGSSSTDLMLAMLQMVMGGGMDAPGPDTSDPQSQYQAQMGQYLPAGQVQLGYQPQPYAIGPGYPGYPGAYVQYNPMVVPPTTPASPTLTGSTPAGVPLTPQTGAPGVYHDDEIDIINATLDPIAHLLSLGEMYEHDCDGSCAHDSSFNPGSERPFYESGWVRARLSDLPDGMYGRVNLAERPFDIEINRRAPLPRAQLSFAHETLHVMNDMFKWGMPHDTIHHAAGLLVSEVLPGLNAMTDAWDK